MGVNGIIPKMISDTILEIPGSNVIIVGLAELDDITYGAFVNLDAWDVVTETYRGYINVVRMNNVKDTFIDNMSIYDDEEWNVISNFFDKSGVFEMNRIERWIWMRINGITLIPKWLYDDADKKRRKVAGMKRGEERKRRRIRVEPKEKEIGINWGATPSESSSVRIDSSNDKATSNSNGDAATPEPNKKAT